MGFLFPHNFLIFSVEFNKLQLQHSPLKTLVLAFMDIILTYTAHLRPSAPGDSSSIPQR